MGKRSDSMYRGREPFTKEQLVFVVEAAIGAAYDRIWSGLPSGGFEGDRAEAMGCEPPESLSYYDTGALEGCGMAVATLYAQLTGDGLGIGDALDLRTPAGTIRGVAEAWVRHEVTGKGRGPRRERGRKSGMPDTRRLAEAWVEAVFDEYLAERA